MKRFNEVEAIKKRFKEINVFPDWCYFLPVVIVGVISGIVSVVVFELLSFCFKETYAIY